MRRKSLSIGAGLAMIAAPAMADVGSHHGADASHFLIQHGWGAALITAVVIAGIVFFVRKKG